MVIGSFDGADIISFPDTPGFRAIELDMNDTTAVSSSPWNGSQQVQWCPADGWTGTITLPQLDRLTVGEWEAWMAECRGMKNVFYLGHPLKKEPNGRGDGEPLLASIAHAQATSIQTHGWEPNVDRQLVPGDHLQLGTYLHRVVNAVSSDETGAATVELWPIVREEFEIGTPIVLANPVGLFRLAENKRSKSTTQTLLSAITFKVREARKNG